MRRLGFSESTIVIVLGVTNRVYRYSARRLGWTGPNPVSLMLPSERPKPSQGKRRRIFEGRELEETIRAAGDSHRTLFTVAALTGARLSELLALTWADVRLDNLDDAELEFGYQVDRHGNRQATKTDGSARTVPIPRELALMLAQHKIGSRSSQSSDFVFCTCTGRPFGQRNVTRALREASGRRRTRAATPRSPCFMCGTIKDGRYRCSTASSLRCIASGTPSQAEPSWPAKALMRSRCSSVIATPT